MESTPIINPSLPAIVLTEQKIEMSDVKLKEILNYTYEHAQKESKAAMYREYYSSLFSVSGTLLLTLLTASFNDIGVIKANVITIIAWVICIGSFLLGLFFLAMFFSSKNMCNIDRRDESIQEILEKQLKNNNQVLR